MSLAIPILICNIELLPYSIAEIMETVNFVIAFAGWIRHLMPSLALDPLNTRESLCPVDNLFSCDCEDRFAYS